MIDSRSLFFWRLDEGPGAHLDDAATGAVGLQDPLAAVDEAAGGEVGTGDQGHQLVEGQLPGCR